MAEHDRFGPTIDDTNEEAFWGRALLGPHDIGEPADSAALVGRCVLADLLLDDLLIVPARYQGTEDNSEYEELLPVSPP